MDAKSSGILTALEPIFGVFWQYYYQRRGFTCFQRLGIIIIVVSALGVSLLPRWLHKEIQLKGKEDGVIQIRLNSTNGKVG